MKKTKLQMTMIAFVAAMLMSGCGEEPYELTDSERELIVDYSAHIVTKYNTYQKEGLSYVWPKEDVTEQDDTIEEPPVSETEPPAVSPENAPESVPGDVATDSTFVPITLTELYGQPDVSVTYVGARLAANYAQSAYYAQYPDAGKQYLILGIDITNNGQYPVSLSYLADTDQFQVTLNNEFKCQAEMTFLAEDFSTFEAIMEAGETRETVLLFQVPDTVTSVDSVDLVVNGDTNYHILLENE